jgi:pimeloyl-ACP methyl ester carboxylesterase
MGLDPGRPARSLATILATSVVLLSGCGGGGDEDGASTAATTSTSTRATASTTTTAAAQDRSAPDAVSICNPARAGWRRLVVKVGSEDLQAAMLGRGRIGFVLANDSGNDPCTWLPFAASLAERGDRVAVFRYASVGSPGELRATAMALRAAGAERVVAVGASVGGRAVVELAAKRSPGVDAVVSLSGEREIGPSYPDILPDARRVELPILYAGSRKDGYTSFGKETVQLHEATPAPLNRILLVPGAAHGVDLLSRREGERMQAAILNFAATAVGQG